MDVVAGFIKEILKTYVRWGREVWGLVCLTVKKIKAGFKNLMASISRKAKFRRSNGTSRLPKVRRRRVQSETECHPAVAGWESMKKVFGKKPVKLLSGFLKYAVVLFLGIVVALSLAPLFSIPGFQSLVVMSGSMEPEIKTGSVVVVKATPAYEVGDVVTFPHPTSPGDLVTHRIEGFEDELIKTKGDANNAADNWEVRREDVQGKVAVSIPYLGYAVHFAKTQRGFVLLILLPALRRSWRLWRRNSPVRGGSGSDGWARWQRSLFRACFPWRFPVGGRAPCFPIR